MTQPSTSTTLADYVRQKRGEKRLTQGELAEAAGISTEHVNRIENGRTTKPQAATLVSLAAALGVTAAELDQLREPS